MLRRGREEIREEIDARILTLPAVLTAWRDAITGAREIPVTAVDGLRTLEIVAACYQSAREEREVDLAITPVGP